MGYILPVTHYQYQDYQQRVIPDQRNPFALDRVFKVTLDHKLKEYYKPREQDRRDSQYLRGKLHAPQTIHYKKNEKTTEMHQQVYSAVTGKGRRFSETI
ncbi:hypothetical protein [Halobacillus campisalis]|uniref:Transposase n=1 Tax=Halobacillus campisalis TaxID=435909 RepID=A0ABW2K3D1_9BACI|nr:hypothetical protein [Halobacillus campisalis]